MPRYRTPLDNRSDAFILGMKKRLRQLGNSVEPEPPAVPLLPTSKAASVFADSPQDTQNFNTSGFAAAPGAPSFNFFVPGTGKCKFDMMVRTDAEAAGERFQVDVLIAKGDVGGSAVHSPNVGTGGIAHLFDPPKTFAENFPGWRYIELDPFGGDEEEGHYSAILLMDTLGTDMDIFYQALLYTPLL